MPGITRRDPQPEGSFPSKFVADRIGERRRVVNLSQEKVADRMDALGHHSWRRQTVAQVETASRNVTVDELVSLALALGCTVRDLLDTTPLGSEPDEASAVIDVGLPDTPVPRRALNTLLGFDPHLRMLIPEVSFSWDDETDQPSMYDQVGITK